MISCVTSSAENKFFVEVSSHINHNNYFRQPKLVSVVTCRDCSGFSNFPTTGFGVQVLVGKSLNEHFRLYSGLLLEYYFTIIKQDSAVAKQMIGIRSPSVEMDYIDRTIQIPIGVAYRIRSFQFFASLNNALFNYPSVTYYPLNGEVLYGAKNKFTFDYHLIPNVGLTYNFPKQNVGISLSSDLSYRGLIYYKLGLTYTFD